MRRHRAWLPALLLGLGALGTVGIDVQREMPLVVPLDSVLPDTIAGYVGEAVTLPPEQIVAAGVTDYVMLNFEAPARDVDETARPPWMSVYVGYYDRQERGRTIHSPKNCMPGGGWEALRSTVAELQTDAGPVRVNRYLLQSKDAVVLVLYWYQGRGRVQSNEYVVKWDMLRDAALRQRTDEALVRIVVPVRRDEEEAFALAAQAARTAVPALFRSLPN